MKDAWIIGVVVALAIPYTFFYLTRTRMLLRSWANRNGCTIISSDYRYTSGGRGPFDQYTSDSQDVLYLTIRDHEGRMRHVWMRCGSFWFGLLSTRIDVVWED
jgi:hypothetical protein